jgi:hypothetical protein
MHLVVIMTLTVAILSALKKVAAAERYHNKWLSDSSTVAIINFEYQLSGESQLTPKDLNPRVGRNNPLRLSNESEGAEIIDNDDTLGCIFRWKHDHVCCYYFTPSNDIKPPSEKGPDSIHHPQHVQQLFNDAGGCVTTVTDEMRTTLADLMNKEPVVKATNNNKRKRNGAGASSNTPVPEKEGIAVAEETAIAEAPRTPNIALRGMSYETTSTPQVPCLPVNYVPEKGGIAVTEEKTTTEAPTTPSIALRGMSTPQNSQLSQVVVCLPLKSPQGLLSPFTQYYTKLHPIISEKMLADRTQSFPNDWRPGVAPNKKANGGGASTKVLKLAKELENHLAAMTNNDASLLASVLIQMIKRQSFASVRNIVVDAIKDEYASSNVVDTTIVDSTKAFLQHHSTNGTRIKVEQDAVDAVLIAATFGATDESVTKVAGRLNQRVQTVKSMAKNGREMKVDKKCYVTRTRKKRFDNVQDPASLAVFRFCHSEESSKLDTESYRVRKVYDVEEQKKKKHPDRVWNDVGKKDQYATFKKSSQYAQFKMENRGDIGLERFRQFCCKCVRDPTAKSCADLIHTGLRYYGEALQAACLTRAMNGCSKLL